MKRIFLTLIMIFCSMTAEAYDIPGTWNVYGTGFVEKSFVRISFELRGEIELYSRDIGENLDCLTSYDVNLRIYALSKSGFDLKVWDDSFNEIFEYPIPIPEVSPTPNNPIVFPAITRGKLTYQLTLTSETAGKLRVKGYVDVDTVGEVEINTDCVVWKKGTQRPDTDSSTKSGCNLGITALMLLLLGVKILVRN
ncbi:MAG: hypothetical protein IJM47_02675 [Synergistaceae bacterium]|nr:hypothetical protein [Synergistaceae bacterium]